MRGDYPIEVVLLATDLNASREYGVADVGHAYAAWFVDPGKNSLSILQYK